MLKKEVTKSGICITLDKELVDLLKKECDRRTMKLSNYIQKLVELGMKHEK